MSARPIIVWFRQDLRLADNPALHTAVQRNRPILPVYIWSPEEEAAWSPGAATRWWVHHSLRQLDAALRQLGSRLIVCRGPALATLSDLAHATRSAAIFWNRRYEPAVFKRDTAMQAALGELGLEVQTFNSALLHEPWTIQTSSGKPFQVFTAFWRACASHQPEAPLPAPSVLPLPQRWPRSAAIASLQLLPTVDWAGGIRRAWCPGEKGAHEQLAVFLDTALVQYAEARNRPDQAATSRLSPHLHFGEIGPRQIHYEIESRGAADQLPGALRSAETFLKELGWREFAHHLLFHFPNSADTALRRDLDNFAWRQDAAALRAWQRGRTGYPIVDAGMRQLWMTGWMHNRVRMIVASFLVKDLLIPWQQGAQWFWDTLVDADLANNTLGWQWTAGCGADAAPYFRVFNPTLQGEKFDPAGDYVRRWVPELAHLNAPWVHRPWQAPAEVLHAARLRLGSAHGTGVYPEPIVDHALARRRALAAFDALRRRAKSPPA